MNCYRRNLQVHFSSCDNFSSFSTHWSTGGMTSRLPKRGRPKVPGKTRRILLREATFDLWNARRETIGILGLTNSQFAEMLLRQEPRSCERCAQQADSRQRRTSSKLFSGVPLFIMARYIHCLFFKKMKSCLTEAVLFPSGRRELFQSTPLSTKSVPVAIELNLSPVQEHGDKSNSL